MSGYLVELLASITENTLYGMLSEIVVIDDGSTDGTVEAVRRWAIGGDRRGITKVHSLPQNRGRFEARLAGARLVRSHFVLFLDTRIKLPPAFGEQLARFLNEHEAVMGTLKIDPSKSIFNLYWKRSHETLFRKTHIEEQHGVLITYENYFQHSTGTTAIACRTDYFLRVCEPYLSTGLISDDTALLYDLTKLSPIYRDSRFFIYWEPRQKLKDFLWYLFDHRGTTFADYHVFERWGKWSAVYFAGLALLACDAVLVIRSPSLGLGAMGALFALLLFSAALFAQSMGEFLRLSPLHVAVVLSYGLGTIRGIFKVGCKRWKGRGAT